MNTNLSERFASIESADVTDKQVVITLKDGTEILVRHFRSAKSLKPYSHSTVQMWEDRVCVWSVRVGDKEEAE